MFETLDVVISLAVVFLILSMVHKYLMSIVKRLLRIKTKVVAEEMKTFVGKDTWEYLIPYLEKKAEYLNFLEDTRIKKGEKEGDKGLRRLNKAQLKEIVTSLKEYIESKSGKEIKEKLGLKVSEDEVKKKIEEIKVHLGTLKNEIENMYDNTLEKMAEVYETKLRHYTLISGLALAVFINADFFEVYDSMSKNSSARNKLVVQAELISTRVSKMADHDQLKEKEEKEPSRITEEIQEVKKNIGKLSKDLEKAGLQLGWTQEAFERAFRGVGPLVNKLLGLFVSGLLISFGAPFWHDFVGSFAGLRRKLKGTEERKGSGPSPPQFLNP